MVVMPVSPLAPREGISASRLRAPVALPIGGLRVGEWLAQEIPWSSPEQRERLAREGGLCDQAGRPARLSDPVIAGEFYWFHREVPPEPRVPFEIEVVHEDRDLLVVDKPHFLASTPNGRFVRECAVTRLRVDRDEPELVAIHRLDRITAGLLVLSRRRETRGTYQRLFQDRRITKTYRAIAGYRPDLPLPLCRSSRLQKTPGTRPVVEVPGRANAYTEIALLRRLPGGSGPDEPGTERAEYRLMPHTGKTHQLRVHLNALGIPIAGDPLYPVDRHEEPEDYSSPLQLLAEELAFTDPLTGRPRRFRSGLRLGAAT